MKRDIQWWQVIALLILISGIILTIWSAQQQDQIMRNDLLLKVSIAKSGISTAQVSSLSGSAADISSLEYQGLKTQLEKIRASDPTFRFAYLLGQLNDGTIIIYADSELPESVDYSPPGQIYTEAPENIRKLFANKEKVTDGPYTDRWGTWLSGFVPVTDPVTGRVIAIYGMDIDAQNWNAAIFKACLPTLIATLLIVLFVLVSAFFQRRSEEEKRNLIVSEKKFSEAFHANPALTTISTLGEGKILDVNASFLATIGYSREEVIGRTVSDLGLYFDPAQRNDIILKIKETGQARNIDVKIYRKNRDLMDCSLSAIVIDVAGTPCLFTAGIDNTDRKRAEEALRESEEKYRSIFNNFPDLYYRTDLNGIITLLSPSLKKLSGWVPEELIGHPTTELYPFPEERLGLIETLSQTGEVQDYEITLLHKNGRYIRTSISSRLIFDDAGKPYDIEGTIRDITERKRYEEALRESEGKLQMALSGSETGMWELNIPSMTGTIDDRAVQILGYQQRDIGHHSTDWDALTHPEDLFLVHKRIADCLEGRTLFFESEYRMRHASGAWIWVESKGKITHRLPDGSPLRITGTLQNITGRKQAEEKLFQLSDRLSLATRAGGVGIWDLDVVNNTLIWDDQMFALYGITREQFSGAYEAWQAGLHPEDRLHGDVEIQLALNGEKEFNTEYRVLWPDGSIHTIRALAIVQRDATGKPLRMIGTNWDITEQKTDEEALRISEEKFRLLIENSHDIIYTITPEGIFTFVSPGWTALLGQPVNDVVGKPIQQFIHPDDLPECLAFLQKTLVTKQRQTSIVYRARHIDGTWRWHTTNAVPLKDKSGAVVAFEGSASDITERKRAEDAILEAHKKINILNSVTRHDILNQITALVMLLQIFEESTTDKEMIEFIHKAEGATERINRQIDFTREYQDIGVQAPQWQNVSDLILSAKKQLAECPYDLKVDLDPVEIYADPLLLKVFHNLLENAVRHGEHVSTVRFSGHVSDESLTLVYEDNGIGVDAESKKHLFQRGFGKHTGYGLYLIREILSISSITIIENGEPGKGARFEIVVPKGNYRLTDHP